MAECEACEPGDVVRGIIALGMRSLISLGPSTRDT